MKILLLLSTLVTPSLAALLIPRSEYLNHNLFKNSEDGKQCDDCCDNGVELKHDVQFFGKKHNKFWPCVNGLISFNGEVRDFTPEKFPIRGQPMVAAFWGDADLRTCRPDVNVRCSYWSVYYDDKAGLLNDKITQKYFKFPQKFKAKVAIIQTWDNVGYYDLQTNKRNTFQIVVVSDGNDNAFAGMFYGRISWTTGDSSDGENGVGGTPAQMGFDAGDDVNFYAHPTSRTDAVLTLQNKEFIYAISKTKICGAGEELDNNNACVALSCRVTKPFPIKDRNGNNQKLYSGLDNPAFIKPTNVDAGECAQFLVDKYLVDGVKVNSDVTCSLQCQYLQNENTGTYLTFQPRYLGSNAKTNAGVTAKCVASEWQDQAAKNCVEVGISAKVVGASNQIEVRESTDSATQAIEIKLKSKPFSSGTVVVEVKTGCKDGKPLKSRGQEYYCNDGKDGAETKPLASFQLDGKSLYATTLRFGAGSTPWDSAQKLNIKGVDNNDQSPKGKETFNVFLRVLSSAGENCAYKGCKTAKPYGSLTKVEKIAGVLFDDEGIELTVIGAAVTDETGKESSFSINPVSKTTGKSYKGGKLKCISSDVKEGKIVAYKVGAGARTDLAEGAIVTLTEEVVTLFVAGVKDDIVDGPKEYTVTCSLIGDTGSILPKFFVNNDVNIAGVLVNTASAKNYLPSDAACPAKTQMVDGCGQLQVSDQGKPDIFTVQLATRPYDDVVIVITQSDYTRIEVSPRSVTFTPNNWDQPQTFTVKGTAQALDLEMGDVKADVDISVDTILTKDKGSTTVKGTQVFDRLGYANCVGSRSKADINRVKPIRGTTTTLAPGATTVATTTAVTTTTTRAATTTTTTGQRNLDLNELNLQRLEKSENCFSFDSSKVTGNNLGKKPDAGRLSLNVLFKADPDKIIIVAGISAVVGGIIAIIIFVVIACAIAGALIAMAIKKKRGEEVDRKADIKKEADQAEGDIAFRMDEMDSMGDMEDMAGVASRMQAERDRLAEENRKLAAGAGEEPMDLASTDDSDVLVEQIKTLKGENDRLRDMQDKTSRRARKNKKNKKEGFGQQQD